MTIRIEQNGADNLQMLAAQRQLYSEAKTIQAIRRLGAMSIAAASPFVVMFVPGWGKWLGALGGLWTLLARVPLRFLEKKWTRQAADIQEQFDTAVFGLPWNAAIAPRPNPQTIAAAARRHLRRNRPFREAALRDWYPDTGSALPPFDVLICQQANTTWSARLHTEWSVVILCGASVWILFGVVLSLYKGLLLSEYLVAVLLPSLPALADGFDSAEENIVQARERRAADSRARQAWEDGLLAPANITVGTCREIQNEVWRLRRKRALVPDWYYRVRKASHESDMRTAAGALLRQARAHGVA